MQFNNKVVLITGAGRGIGRRIAQAFAENGATVIINYLHSDIDAQNLRDDLTNRGFLCSLYKADVSVAKDVIGMIEFTKNMFGKLDVLVNNAGLTVRGKIKDISEDDWDRVVDVNMKGTFLCSKYASELMIEGGGGCIINLASMRGITGSSSSMHYAASKAGVIALTKCLALELAPMIRANCIAPGYTFTDLHKDKTEEQIKEISKNIPLKRFGQVEDVANAAIFLASEQSSFITGETIVVSGGEVML